MKEAAKRMKITKPMMLSLMSSAALEAITLNDDAGADRVFLH